MDKFDKNYFDSDPETGRPFCGGYPDGVLMICNILGIFTLAVLILALTTFLTAIKGMHILLLATALCLAAAAAYPITIYFLLHRSAKSIITMGILTIAALIPSEVVFVLGLDISMVFVVGFAIVHALFFLYLLGLQRDGLLS